MRFLKRALIVAALILAGLRPVWGELTIAQGTGSWSDDERVAIRKTPRLTAITPIPETIDPAQVEQAEIVCFASASRDAGEKNIRGARGRYATYAYSINETTLSFEKTLLDSGVIKTDRTGRARWSTHIPTTQQISLRESARTLAWSVSDLVWTNKRKVEFTFLSCLIVDQQIE
jgi:hypothetical protein